MGGLLLGENRSLIAAVSLGPNAACVGKWGFLPHCAEDMLPGNDVFSTSSHPLPTLLSPCQIVVPVFQLLPSTEDRNKSRQEKRALICRY